jgi:hypothetical protein
MMDFVFTVLSVSYDAEQNIDGSMEMQGSTNSGSNPVSSSFQSSLGSAKFVGGNGLASAVREIPRGEINDRFRTVIVKSVDFLINVGMYIEYYYFALHDCKVVMKYFVISYAGFTMRSLSYFGGTFLSGFLHEFVTRHTCLKLKGYGGSDVRKIYCCIAM